MCEGCTEKVEKCLQNLKSLQNRNGCVNVMFVKRSKRRIKGVRTALINLLAEL